MSLQWLKSYFKEASKIKADELLFRIYKTTEFEYLVVSLITEGQPSSQLAKGLDADGDIIGVYSRATEIITGGKKKAGSPFTLKDTGFYYDSHKVVAALEGFTIVADSKTNKKGDFLQRLSIDANKVQDLSDGNLQIVIDEVKDFLPDMVREFLSKARNN